MNINDGGPAFPGDETDYVPFGTDGLSKGVRRPVAGMSLRDWFAGQAIGAIIERCGSDHRAPHEALADYFARRAYEVADALVIAARPLSTKGEGDE